MPFLPRPEVASLAAGIHGAVGEAELEALGLSPEGVVDFSVSTNPFGPSPLVREALSQVNLARYPDPEARALVRALAEKLGLDPAQVVAGNGSLEVLWLLALACLRPGDRALILGPTFGEYERACRLHGAQVLELRAREEDFQLDLVEARRLLRRERPRLAFLCQPNNPTGLYLGRREVEGLLEAVGPGLLVMDESYVNFVPRAWPSLPLLEGGHLFLLRSLTKDYALGGLRLGYGLGPREVVEGLRRARPPWSINSLAQAAGLAALEDQGHLERSLQGVQEAKAYLSAQMAALGFTVRPSAAHFFLVEVGNALSFRSRLLRRGFCVRDCSSFGLPRFVRLAPRTLPECEHLVEALKGLAP